MFYSAAASVAAVLGFHKMLCRLVEWVGNCVGCVAFLLNLGRIIIFGFNIRERCIQESVLQEVVITADHVHSILLSTLVIRVISQGPAWTQTNPQWGTTYMCTHAVQ